MKLPKKLITVTSFSKYLAMALFVLFPFLGFYLGIQFQKFQTSQFTQSNISHFNNSSYPTILPNQKVTFQTYADNDYGFSFKYPSTTSIEAYTPSAGSEKVAALIPKPLKQLAFQPGGYGGMILSIYNIRPYIVLNSNYSITDPCGSNYGALQKNELLVFNNIHILHRETFHDESNSAIQSLNYGTREDYCFISKSGNLVVLGASTGTLNADFEKPFNDYILSILPTLTVQ